MPFKSYEEFTNAKNKEIKEFKDHIRTVVEDYVNKYGTQGSVPTLTLSSQLWTLSTSEKKAIIAVCLEDIGNDLVSLGWPNFGIKHTLYVFPHEIKLSILFSKHE